MSTLKHSRQRASIKNFLSGRTDHPTADTIYTNLRQVFPNISLGTVYRNLSLLSDMGEILKVSPGNGPDRFDGNTSPHYHFICNRCQRVIDLEMERIDSIIDTAGKNFDGEIESYVTHFFGICGDCHKDG